MSKLLCPRVIRVPLIKDELIWAAGFFDGEGGSYAVNSMRHGKAAAPRPMLVIAQANVDPDDSCPPQVLVRFMCAVGGLGRIFRERRNRDTNPNRKPQWVYRVVSFEEEQAIVAMLWPWISDVKRQQARRALAKVHGWHYSRPRQLKMAVAAFRKEASGLKPKDSAP